MLFTYFSHRGGNQVSHRLGSLHPVTQGARDRRLLRPSVDRPKDSGVWIQAGWVFSVFLEGCSVRVSVFSPAQIREHTQSAGPHVWLL